MDIYMIFPIIIFVVGIAVSVGVLIYTAVDNRRWFNKIFNEDDDLVKAVKENFNAQLNPEKNKKYCEYCGQELDSNATICESCGAKIDKKDK